MRPESSSTTTGENGDQELEEKPRDHGEAPLGNTEFPTLLTAQGTACGGNKDVCDCDLGNDSGALDSESEVLSGVLRPTHPVCTFSFTYEQGQQDKSLSCQNKPRKVL